MKSQSEATYKRRYSFYIGITIGAVVFFLIYGFGVIIPTNVTWLYHSVDLEGLADLTQHELGWEMFRRSPWLFPIGLFRGLSPEPISIVYTDSIPLFAIIFKLLSPVLPEDFQYMGIFELITYVLMGGFGALIADRFAAVVPEETYKSKDTVHAQSNDRNLLIRRMLFAVCTSLILVTCPVLTKRVFYHTALSAHFLILAAILIVIYKNELGKVRERVLFVILVFLCTLINAYYIPMVMGIYGCSILYGFLTRHRKGQKPSSPETNIHHSAYAWLADLGTLFISGIVSLLCGALLGMFGGGVSSSAENMENVSYNLTGLFNPRNDLLVHLKDMPLFDYNEHTSFSIFFKGWSQYSPWQSEGFSYLGVGVIILTLLVAFLACAGIKKGSFDFNIKMAAAVTITALVFLLLAMGPMGTIGTHKLYSIHWPDAIYQLLAVFRTAGRFIWVIYFGLIALVIMYASWAEEKYMLIVIILCTAIQIFDISPSLVAKHDVYYGISAQDEHKNELCDSSVFSYLGEQCDEILFVNPTTAIRMRPYWSTVFEEYAIKNDMSMNAAYCSRDTTKSADSYSDENLKQRQAGKKFENILYVFINEDIMKEQAPKFDLNVYRYDNIYIGTDLDLSDYSEVIEVTD